MAANSFGAGATDLSLPVEHQQENRTQKHQRSDKSSIDVPFKWQIPWFRCRIQNPCLSPKKADCLAFWLGTILSLFFSLLLVDMFVCFFSVGVLISNGHGNLCQKGKTPLELLHVTCSQLIIFLVHTCRKRHRTYYLSFPVTAMEMSALWACMGKICNYKSFDFF